MYIYTLYIAILCKYLLDLSQFCKGSDKNADVQT